MKKIFTAFLLLIFTVKAYSQITGITIANAPALTMNCPDLCTTLHANYPKPLKTTQYTVSAVPYSPLNVAGTTINFQDDKFTTAIPLGFDFCFFNNVYSQCYIADNGVLTFNPAYNSGSCNNNIQQTLPYFNSTFPDNAIFYMFMDINPNLGGSVKYTTTGSAPFRKFVVNYQNVKLFGNTCANAGSNFQVVLSETTNEIEVFIGNKVLCDADTTNHANYGTVGIQNIAATSVYTAPGKHASIFTASMEGIKFSPAGPIDYTMTWNTPGVIATNTDSVVVCPGYYPFTVYATIHINCPSVTFQDTIVLNKNLPVINNVQIVQPICDNDPTGAILVNATVFAPPAQYAINGGPYGPSNIFTGLQDGTYLISVMDANGCKKDTVVVIEPLTSLWLQIDTMIHPICPDTTGGMVVVTPQGGLAPYNISWSNGDVGNVCDSIGPGGVICTVQDANGCIQQFPLIIPYDSLPDVQAVFGEPVCGDSSGFITISITGGTPGYTILWNTGDTTLGINNLPAGTYNVTVTDSKGCVSGYGTILNNAFITQTSKIHSNTKCGLNNGIASITAFGGVAPYTYNWQPSGQTTATAINLPPGTHYCTTLDANNCMKKDTFIILPSVATINNLSFTNANCDTSNGFIYLNGVQNATNGFSIQWSNGQPGNLISNLPAGYYWVTTTDGNGCVASDTIHILNDGKPQAIILSYVEPKCNGDKGSAVLGGMFGTAPYKYSLDNITYSSDANLYNILAGVYTIYISDANSCTNSTVVTFTQPPLIDLNYEADSVVCYNDFTATITVSAFGGTPGFVYSFNNGIYSYDTVFYQNTQGVYQVLVKDSNNCVRAFNVVVPGPDEPLDVKFNKKNVYCEETNTGSLTANIVGGWEPYQYVWDNGANTLSFSNLGDTTMTISVTDNLGCKIEREVFIENLKCCRMVVPNAFTPNGDGLNDYFRPIAVSSEVNAIKLSVYDRWGHLMFATKTLGDKWDGNKEEIPCNMGVYFYRLEYWCPQERQTFVIQGDVTLIR